MRGERCVGESTTGGLLVHDGLAHCKSEGHLESCIEASRCHS